MNFTDDLATTLSREHHRRNARDSTGHLFLLRRLAEGTATGASWRIASRTSSYAQNCVRGNFSDVDVLERRACGRRYRACSDLRVGGTRTPIPAFRPLRLRPYKAGEDTGVSSPCSVSRPLLDYKDDPQRFPFDLPRFSAHDPAYAVGDARGLHPGHTGDAAHRNSHLPVPAEPQRIARARRPYDRCGERTGAPAGAHRGRRNRAARISAHGR